MSWKKCFKKLVVAKLLVNVFQNSLQSLCSLSECVSNDAPPDRFWFMCLCATLEYQSSWVSEPELIQLCPVSSLQIRDVFTLNWFHLFSKAHERSQRHGEQICRKLQHQDEDKSFSFICDFCLDCVETSENKLGPTWTFEDISRTYVVCSFSSKKIIIIFLWLITLFALQWQIDQRMLKQHVLHFPKRHNRKEKKQKTIRSCSQHSISALSRR